MPQALTTKGFFLIHSAMAFLVYSHYLLLLWSISISSYPTWEVYSHPVCWRINIALSLTLLPYLTRCTNWHNMPDAWASYVRGNSRIFQTNTAYTDLYALKISEEGAWIRAIRLWQMTYFYFRFKYLVLE